ncbi:MotA/TolQ/ExbB proton channel family protein [Halomonadaceae bacterium KBTZ08]
MQTPTSNVTEHPLMEVVVRFFQDGGLFMIPIGLILVIGLAIVLERMIYLQVARRRNRTVFETGIWPLLQKGEFQKASKAARESGVEVGEMVAAGLARFRNSQSRSDVEYAMEEGLMEVLPRFEKRTPYLATLANVATLLGLLGTIMGLISAFTAVADADPANKASMLSDSISVAMNTTAFGLMSAIPLLLAHAYLQTRTNEMIDSLEMAGVKLLNLISETQAGSNARSEG